MCFDIELQTKEFFDHNDHSDTILSLIVQPIIQGTKIKIVSRLKNSSKEQIKQKEQILEDLLEAHKKSPYLDVKDKIDSARL